METEKCPMCSTEMTDGKCSQCTIDTPTEVK